VQALYSDLARTYNATEEARIIDVIVRFLRKDTKGGCGCPFFEGNIERALAAVGNLPDKEYSDMAVKMVDVLEAEHRVFKVQKQNLDNVHKVREE